MLASISGVLASKSLPNLPTLEVFSMPVTSQYGGAMFYTNGTFGMMGFSNVGGFPSYSYWSDTNGATWTRVSQPAYEWRGLANNNGTISMLSGNSGMGNRSITSTDGKNWTQRVNLPATDYWYALGAGNGIFIGGRYSGSTLTTSTDGVTWSNLSSSVSGVDGVAYNNGVWLIVSRNSNAVFRSTNPTVSSTWQSITKAGYSFAVSYIMVEGGKFFTYSSSNATTSTLLMSDDGLTWTPLVIPFGGVGSITRCGNYWLASGSSAATGNVSAFLISKDLVSWATMTIPPAWRDLRGSGKYANGYYVGSATSVGVAYRLSGFIA